MEKRILIHNNRIRVFGNQFLAIVNPDYLKVNVNGKYPCHVMFVGDIGVVECLSVKLLSLGDLAENEDVNMICDDQAEFKEFYRRMGLFSTHVLQLGVFKVLRWKDGMDRELLKTELKRKNIVLEPQSSLF